MGRGEMKKVLVKGRMGGRVRVGQTEGGGVE